MFVLQFAAQPTKFRALQHSCLIRRALDKETHEAFLY